MSNVLRAVTWTGNCKKCGKTAILTQDVATASAPPRIQSIDCRKCDPTQQVEVRIIVD